MQTKNGFKLVNIHMFCGFYESVLDAQLDNELESCMPIRLTPTPTSASIIGESEVL